MSHNDMDIKDDEIRVISSDQAGNARKSRKRPLFIAVIALLIVAAVCAIYFSLLDGSEDSEVDGIEQLTLVDPVVTDSVPSVQAYTLRRDTVVNGAPLTILTPCNATPVLVLGDDILDDTTAVLVAQAADTRLDNGGIAGAFVVNGELLSRGEAKAGFCAIVNGDVTVGVADATPMLEQALVNEGHFFRQYPLVVGGQLVENKPKGRALRKALAEIDGRICVVAAKERLTFHDFSQALIDAGARNAIYLVGATSSGFYADSDGQRHPLGPNHKTDLENINYIVWR